MKNLKDEEIGSIQTKNKSLGTENKIIKQDYEELKKEQDLAKLECFETKIRL